MTTIRSRGASATTAAARGTRAWATPRRRSPRPTTSSTCSAASRSRPARSRRRLRQAGRQPGADGDRAAQPVRRRDPRRPGGLHGAGHRSGRRHAHLRVGLRRRRHRDHQGRDAHLHRGRRVLRQGDRLRRQGRHRTPRCCRWPSSRCGDNSEEVGVGGLVPGVLALNITGSANFGLFVPGVTRDYEASLAATATSTAIVGRADGARSELDGDRPPGQRHDARWRRPLQVKATDAANPDSAFAPVPENGTRLRLLTLPAPVSGHPMTIGFKQSIAATESLKTGPLRQDAGVHALGDHAVSTTPPARPPVSGRPGG